jgi:hypothetical protein
VTFADLHPALADLEHDEKLQARQFLNAELAKGETDGYDLRGIPQDLADQSDEAYKFYVAELRPLLEPQHNGDYVAIDVGSGSYEVARGLGKAFRALRARHPNGKISVLQIGPADHSLVSRMRGERPL